MSYSPTTIANYFLDRASLESRAVTPMQLLKLVYIAHGWHLGYLGTPLIDEEVQAWKYGPVIHSLYNKMRHYGSGAVSQPLGIGHLPWVKEPTVDPQTASLLDSVWKSYAGFSGLQLSNMTHQDDTPWDIAWHREGGHSKYFAPISDKLIEEHYKKKIAAIRAKNDSTAQSDG